MKKSITKTHNVTMGIDLGAVMKLTPWIKAAAGFQNINKPSIRLIEQDDTFPFRWHLGAAVEVPNSAFSLTGQIRGEEIEGINFAVGGELRINRKFETL